MGYHKAESGSGVHTPFRWVFANATERGAESVVAADVNKMAWQQSDNTIWVLEDDSPVTWSQIGTTDIFSDTLRIGVDQNSLRVDGEEKAFDISCYPNTNSDFDTGVLRAYSASDNSEVHIGRGNGSTSYAVKAVQIWAGTGIDTLSGSSTRLATFTVGGCMLWGATYPTGGEKGIGTLNAKGLYDDGNQLTGYVLDKAFNKDFEICAWDKKSNDGKAHLPARRFNDKHKINLDVDAFCKYIEDTKTLPAFTDIEEKNDSSDLPSVGDMIQRLWETVEVQAVHIKKLNDRIKKLEATNGTI